MEADSEEYSEPCQTFKMEVFAKIVKGFSFFTIFAKNSILHVWQDSEFASEVSNDLRKKLYLSVLIIFAKLLPICLLNLINILHHISRNKYCARLNPCALMFNIFA